MSALPILLSIGLAAGPSTAVSAAPVPADPTSPTRSAPIEITIAPSAGDVERMDRWMQIAADQGMQMAGVTAQDIADDRTLVVEIEGTLLEYRYLVGVRTPDGWASAPQRANCSCRDQVLLEQVRLAVSTLGPQLRATAPEPVAVRRVPAEMGTGGIAGVTLLGAGGGAVVGGIVMLALPPEWSVDAENLEQERGQTMRLPGAIVAGAGVAMLAVGAALLHRDRTKRRAMVAPSAGRRGIGVMAVVRF